MNITWFHWLNDTLYLPEWRITCISRKITEDIADDTGGNLSLFLKLHRLLLTWKQHLLMKLAPCLLCPQQIFVYFYVHMYQVDIHIHQRCTLVKHYGKHCGEGSCFLDTRRLTSWGTSPTSETNTALMRPEKNTAPTCLETNTTPTRPETNTVPTFSETNPHQDINTEPDLGKDQWGICPGPKLQGVKKKTYNTFIYI